MPAAELLESLESRTHNTRVQAMIELGRQADGDSRATFAQFEQGNTYERMLALYSCFGSRDSAHVLRALNDPSHLIRGVAIRIASQVCSADDLWEALRSVADSTRPGLLARLRRAGQTATIDRYLELPETLADPRFCLYLPFGSHEMAIHHLPEFALLATPENWRQLARIHPTIVLEHLLRQARAATEWDGPLLERVNELLPLLVKADAPQAVELVSALARTVELTAIKFEPLVQRLPRAVADLLLAGGPEMNSRLSCLRDSARKLSAEQVIAVCQRSKNGSRNAFGWNYNWFGQLAPDQRAAVFSATRLMFRHGKNPYAEVVVAALPRVEREHEARTIVSSSQVNPYTRLGYAQFLPWDEMRRALVPYMHSSDLDMRQKALETLIRAVLFHRAHLTEVLSELRERRTEQDGTRLVMLRHLYKLPQSAWHSEHLPILGEIIRHGLDDVGMSSATHQQIIGLLLKLMPIHEEWATQQLATVMRERGWQLSASPAPLLPRATESALARALLPQIEQWMARDDDEAALSAVKDLYVRLDTLALALPLLEQLLQRTRTRKHAEAALELIAERTRDELGGVILRLLAADGSWITFPLISDWLLRHRQDLLSPYLDLKPVAGRWGTGSKPFLFPVSRPFGGGTATQQERLADAALARVADTTQDTYAITQAINLLPLLPAVAPSRITLLADDPRSVVRTTALFALARLDTPAGVPTLIAALQDARARIAIHTLHSRLRQMPVNEALRLLRDVPFERVAVAKEIVRLVSELDGSEAWEQLVAYWRQPLHRDVRVALLHSLDRHLARPQAWEILEEGARDPDSAVALATISLSSLAVRSLPVHSTQEVRVGTLRLVASLLKHPEREVRTGCRTYCRYLGIADDAHVATPQLLSSIYVGAAPAATIEQQEEAIESIYAFFGVCSSADGEPVAAMLYMLMPHRRALIAAVSALKDAGHFKRRQLLPVLHAALTALEADTLLTGDRAGLALGRLPPGNLGAFLLSLSGLPGWHARTLTSVATALRQRAEHLTAGELDALEQTLASSDDAQLRWLAFKALEVRVNKEGDWTDPLLARLDVYRRDTSPLVASDAQFTLTDRDTF